MEFRKTSGKHLGMALFESLVAIGIVSLIVLALSLVGGRLAALSYLGYHQQVADDLLHYQIVCYHQVPHEIEDAPVTEEFKTDSAIFVTTTVSRAHGSGSDLYTITSEVVWHEKGKEKRQQKTSLAMTSI